MRRKEFLTELNLLLQDISEEEREAAMQYYSDYFHEAGEEQEESVIKQLGSPAKVAAEVKMGLQGQNEDAAEYRETGYADTRFEYREELTPNGSKEHYGKKVFDADVKETKTGMNKTVKTILLVLLILAALPIIGPVVFGGVALLFGITAAVLAVGASLVISAIIIGIVGIIVAAAGIVKIFTSTAVGFLVTGVGIILTVLGVVSTVLLIKVCAIVFPAIVRGIAALGRKVFRKEKAVA